MSTAVVATPAPVPTPAAVAAPAVPAPVTAGGFQSVSLYVGDLHGDVTEANLFEIFSKVGTVQSIRVCRDIITRRSLGYAYVNFTAQEDAAKAIELLNAEEIRGRPCRVMWSQRDPSIRKSGRGNIFIKNLNKNIDIKSLHDTFSQFGNILSCKIEFDQKGESKGYGYIQFADQESAQQAIEKVNGMELQEKQVFVGPFVPRRERIQANSSKEFTNIFIKNLDEKVDDEKLTSMFSMFGQIKSVAIMRDGDGKSKGFGFVNFENAEDAAAAVAELNGKEVQGKAVFVGRAMKKSERESELRQKFEALKQEQLTKYHGVNLYVKNIDDEIDSDDKLRGIFAPFGTITSAKIMKDPRNGISKGFGFVCFGTPEEATKAVQDLNGKIISKKPLYVALHERKEIRRNKLEQHFAQRNKIPARGPQQMGYAPNGAPVFYGGVPPQMMGYPPQMIPRGRFAGPNYPPQMPNQQQQFMMMQQGGRGGRGGYPNGAIRGGMAAQRGRGGMPKPPMMPGVVSGPQGPAAVPLAQVPPEALQAPAQLQAPGLALTPQSLEGLSPEDRKRMLGEQLFPLVQRLNPLLAGKITGMILESADTAEVIALIERPPQLAAKVQEAIDVLNQHSGAINAPKPE